MGTLSGCFFFHRDELDSSIGMAIRPLSVFFFLHTDEVDSSIDEKLGLLFMIERHARSWQSRKLTLDHDYDTVLKGLIGGKLCL